MSTTSTGSSWPRSPKQDEPGDTARAPHGAAEVRAALRSLGVTPLKRWGQSFLTDPFVADAEAALVEAPPGTPLVEIGGGLGILTEALLRKDRGPVTVFERDARLARFLAARFGDRVRVREVDALTAPWEGAGTVVGNLPFSIATPVLLRCFRERVGEVVALIQREVATRLSAGPGSRDYGRLTILASLYGTVRAFQTVPSRLFEPEPAVDGRIVHYRAREGPLPVRRPELLESALRTLFSGRRKQLRNLVRGLVPGREGHVIELIRAASWPDDWPRRRPEELAPEEYFRLANAIEDLGRVPPHRSSLDETE